MKKFPIIETALCGYRLLVAKPGAALVWFVVQLAATLGTLALTVAMAGPQMTALRELQASGQPQDPATTMALSGPVMLAGLVSLLVSLVLWAVWVGAISRAMLRPEDKRFAYLRFGADELRLLVVLLVIGIFLYIAYMLAFGPAMAVLMAVAGPMQAAQALQGVGSVPSNAIAAAVAASLPGVLLMLFLGTKLSLAGAQTVVERGIHIFGSWRLTKGVFWRSLGAYLLSLLPALLLFIVVSGIGVALHGGGLSAALTRAMQPDVSSMAALFSPMQLIGYLLQSVAVIVATVGLLAPPAAIYAAIANRSNAALAEVFGDDEDDDEDED